MTSLRAAAAPPSSPAIRSRSGLSSTAQVRCRAGDTFASEAVAPIVGRRPRDFQWRDGLGNLKNLMFFPTWHYTHDTVNQFCALQTVARGPQAHTWATAPADLSHVAWPQDASLETFLAQQQVDGFALVHQGALVHESYLSGTRPSTRHSLASITRSLTGMTAGILVDRGMLDLTSPLETWMPQVCGSGYEGVTVRQLLDMRSGVNSSAIGALQSMHLIAALPWQTRHDGLHAWSHSLKRAEGCEGPGPWPFEYRTGDSEILGQLCEHVTATSMATLWSTLLWQPLGAAHDASVMVDGHNHALFGGGLAMTLRDTALLARMILRGGTAHDGGPAILPRAYIDDMFHGDADTRAAFPGTMLDLPLPGGMYRNQSWSLQSAPPITLLLGAGGQLVYLDPSADFAAIVTSHWGKPYDTTRMAAWLDVLPRISAAVASEPSARALG
uniref:Beta-lactamase-related domain-containing protein n=2 Tax=Auxenochlorella protothecoides TaxID=3075 RepID=A0A1D2AC51_AUXPR